MFSDNLKKLRKEKNITQSELAERLHVVRQTISKWEKGLSVPDSDMLVTLAHVLEVNIDELLGECSNIKDPDMITRELELIKEELRVKNRREEIILKIVSTIIAILLIIQVFMIGATLLFGFVTESDSSTVTEETEVIENTQ